MIKTFSELEALKDGNQKSAWYELHFLNEYLAKQNLRCEIVKRSADYTYNIMIGIVPLDAKYIGWYELENESKYKVFKNWSDASSFVEGLRFFYYHGVVK